MTDQVTLTETFATAGTYSWICPVGVTAVKVECWAAGGGGGASQSTVIGFDPNPGAGGGEYAAEYTEAVTPGTTYSVVVGAGGTAGTTTAGHAGGNGGNSSFSGSGSTTVTANGGEGGQSGNFPTGGGSGSTNSIHFNGGNDTTQGGTSAWGGGGGGSSAGVNSAGGNGVSGSSPLGGSGGLAPTGGGNGGNGGTSTACVTLDTKIYTQRGWLAYDELSAGDTTMSVNIDTGIVELTRVTRINVHPGTWEMYEVTGEGLNACVNAEHRWLVLRDQVWKYAVLRELQPDDIIPLGTGGGTMKFSECEIVQCTVEEPIWCPTTENGNWLAARNGTAYFIGNKPS